MIDDPTLRILTSILTILAGLGAGTLAAVLTRRTSKEQNKINGSVAIVTQYESLTNQLQEERTSYENRLKEQREASDDKIDKLTTRVENLEQTGRKRDQIFRRYIAELHAHIYAGSPPPPPPLPSELDN